MNLRLIAILSAMAVAMAALGGCGSSKPETAATKPAPTPAVAAPTATKPSPKVVLAKCLKRLKLALADEPSTTKDRVAVGAAGNLPARYIGVITYRGKPMIDVWQADDNAGGKATADALNEATAEAEGVTEVEAAYSQGRAVSAPFNNLVLTKVPDEVPGKIDKCLDLLND